MSFVLFFGHAFGAELDITPGIEVSEYYTDNISLSNRQQAKSGLITQTTPSLRLRSTGRRITTALDYQMQSLSYSRSEIDNQLRHQAAVSLGVTAIPDQLNIDAGASFDQQYINPAGIIDPQNIAPFSNLTNVINYHVRPHYDHRVGSWAIAALAYSLGETRYRAPAYTGNNTVNQNFDAQLSGNDLPGPVDWKLHYQRTVSDTINNTDTVFEKTEARTTYDVTGKTTLIASAGYENNHYQALSANNNITGSLWSLGMRWSMSQHTSATLAFGHRFFGTTKSLDLEHRTRLTNLSVAYDEDLTTSSLLQAVTPVFDTNGNPIVSLEDPAIAAQVYLNKKLTAQLSAQISKTQLNINASHSKRIGQSVPGGENIYSATGTLIWRIGPRTNIEGSGHALYRDLYDNPETVKQADARLGISRKIRPQLTAGIYYSLLKRVTAASPIDYTRNLVQIEVRASSF